MHHVDSLLGYPNCSVLDEVSFFTNHLYEYTSDLMSQLLRIYNEFYWKDMAFFKSNYIQDTPVAVSNFPNEIFHVTKFGSGESFGNIKL